MALILVSKFNEIREGDVTKIKIFGMRKRIRILTPRDVISPETIYREYSDEFESAGKLWIETCMWRRSGAVGELVSEYTDNKLLAGRGRRRQYAEILPIVGDNLTPVLLNADCLERHRRFNMVREDCDWGYGQMAIDFIIRSGYNDARKFRYFGEITANEHSGEVVTRPTITAGKDCLFIYPIERVI